MSQFSKLTILFLAFLFPQFGNAEEPHRTVKGIVETIWRPGSIGSCSPSFRLKQANGDETDYTCEGSCDLKAVQGMLYQHVIVDANPEWPAPSGCPQAKAFSVSGDSTEKPIPSILKTVIIQGKFEGNDCPGQATHFKGWSAGVIWPSDYSDSRKGAANFRDAEKTRKRFPVNSDGSFEIVLQNVPVGEGYYLESDAGSQRFAILEEKIKIVPICEQGD